MYSLRTKRFAYSFIVIFILTNILWNIIFRHNQNFLDWGAVTFQIITCCASIGWLISTFLKHKGAAKSFWLFLGLGVLSYLIGIVIWSYNEFILNRSGEFDNIAEKFFIVQNGLYFLALLVVINELKSNLFTVKFILDMLIAMSAAITLSWIFIIEPLLRQHLYIKFNMIELLYPILDLGVLVGILILSYASNTIFSKKTTFLLISGLSSQIIADSIFNYLKVMNSYTVGSINEPFWILSIFLIGLSGIYHVQISAKAPRVKHGKNSENLFAKYFTPYMSVLLLSLYFIITMYKINTVIIGLVICILLVILRQIFTLLENDQLVKDLNNLNEGLELKVKERTDKLVETVNSMEYLAYHDVVTGLPNRRYIQKRLSQAIDANDEDQKRIAFILLDLDRFKQINDSLGHTYGDLLLEQVGKRLVNCVPNEVVSRLGGDEYALLIENTNLQNAEKIADKLLKTLRETFNINGVELHITPSIGISFFPDNGDDWDTLLKKADTAMYEVKENGKNNYRIYSCAMSMEPIMELENAMRKGLERNEYILHYQPQISLTNNEIIGAEALVRWERAGGELIPPSKFIPLAEENGLIWEIGERVLREACKQSVYWRERGFTKLRIAVNISCLQFKHNDFIQMVSKIIEETKANPNDIELEITESIAMGPIDKNLAQLSTLKKMGFQIAIDDFGTGYSSLQYLSEFQIDHLKIDRSFINALEKSEKDAAIVKLIVMMAKGLNFKVIAEGVETEAQKLFLQEIECDELQGYLMSRPLSVEDFEKLMASQNRRKII
ncbi:putative bifunctional diguanylate cyclase/phosphodiesterase [Rummeliibacillus pycnus]|uniref:putative bifunctional diguanylate cyclase/phosphodiesterase n=1 Tax=Rummeliibacillus pycnus TaxID=101070 RepID=UPI000C99F4E1|nr:EAL domain-containing protein [Rummeliibacillus pycnus]